jgi:hypothetical protein
MLKQITDKVLMVRPRHFRMNEQTAVNNYYQQSMIFGETIEKQCITEFDSFVKALRGRSIEVFVVDDLEGVDTPDSIFPNNWISFHDNAIVTYPMFAANRRLERREDIIMSFGDNLARIALEHYENDGLFLEGTGSLVLDRVGKVAYASISERTSENVVRKWCDIMGFHPCFFHSFQRTEAGRQPVYHTNVVLSIGTEWALICSAAIDNETEREQILSKLSENRVCIDISEDAMDGFGANILEVKSSDDKKSLIMSTTAFSALKGWMPELSKYAEPLVVDIKTIETAGGGSARCMLAEVFLFSQEF